MLATLVTTSSAIVVVPCSLCSVESPFAAAAGVFAKLEAVFSSAIVRSSSAELVRRGLSRISCSEIVPRFHEPETDADPTSPRPTQQAPSGGEPTFRFPYSGPTTSGSSSRSSRRSWLGIQSVQQLDDRHVQVERGDT